MCIATGRYESFVPELVRSLSRFGAADLVFCLSDSIGLLSSQRMHGLEVKGLPWGSLPWPFPTLWRYSAIQAYADLFTSEASHLVYLDVDTKVVGDCDLLYGNELIAVSHPGYYRSAPDELPFEETVTSTAFVDRSRRQRYVAGGVQGGPTDQYLQAAEECRRSILDDYRRGLVARWHDESHWNAFVSRHSQVRVLGPEYCWPEELPGPPSAPHILALRKDHHALRQTRPSLTDQLRAGAGRVRGLSSRRRG